MRHTSTAIGILVSIASSLCVALSSTPLDRLDMSSPSTSQGVRTPLAASARAGDRLIAVGVRGLIIVSDDKGMTWSQVMSPVASDLLAVHFASPMEGWVVGHDGVILYSSDGGNTWVKQMDGRQAAQMLADYFKRRQAEGDSSARRWLDDIALNYGNGPEQALLDVWFEDNKSGFVVGSFGTIFRTIDGGKTWLPWMDKVQSTELVHLNAVRGCGGEVYVASEKGVVFRLDREQVRFEPVATGYKGSFFGVVCQASDVIAYGLLGNAYRSSDHGLSWNKVDTGLRANVTAGLALADGRVLLLGLDGRATLLDAANDQHSEVPLKASKLLTSAVQLSGKAILLTGQDGIKYLSLP